MLNLERVIRHALTNIDTKNDALREQVYRAVWDKHERIIVADQQLSDENRHELRNKLTSLIRTIESEYTTINKHTPTNLNDTATEADFTFDNIKEHSLNEIDKKNYQNVLHRVGPEELGVAPTGKNKAKLQNQIRWWRSNLILMIFLVLLVLVAWAFYKSFTIINRTNTTQTHISNHQGEVIEQEYATQNDNWITIFDPSRISDFSIQGNPKAQIKSDGKNKALRFESNSIDDKVIIDVGSSILEKLRGKTVTFNINARSANSAKAQIAISCNFSLNDSCATRHFDLQQTSEPLLFSVEIPKNINTNGKFFLQNALLGSEYVIDIYLIKVRIEE